MKNIIDLYEASLLDEIDDTIAYGNKLATYQFIRELYYSSDRKSLNKNWNIFKKNCLHGSHIDPKSFKRGKLYIGASKADYSFNNIMKSVTYVGVIRGKDNKIYMNQSNFLSSTPFAEFDLDRDILTYEPAENHPIDVFKTKKKFIDLKKEFDKIINTFEWYEVPAKLVPYIEKIVIVDAEANSSNWKIPKKIRRKDEYGDLNDL